MKIPIFPGKYHQNGGFSMAMLVSGRVGKYQLEYTWGCTPFQDAGSWQMKVCFFAIPYDYKCYNPGGDWHPGRGDNPKYTHLGKL